MSLRLVFGELFTGLRRNLTMTLAVVITVAVSLSLFGGAVLVGRQVDSMKDYWYDKVEVSIFLCGKVSDTPSCAGGEVTQAQRDEILAEIESLKPSLVQDVFYETKAEAFERFKAQFPDSPLVEQATVDSMPESYRVKLVDPERYQVVSSAFQGRPGIESVTDQRQTLDRLFTVLGALQALALVISIAMLVVMILLVFNTMRLAAFSRRRETSIKRLVGASALSIQLPFVLEAATAAALGGLLAVGLLALGFWTIVEKVLRSNVPFTNYIGWDQFVVVGPGVFILGLVVASLAAFVTLVWYTRV